MLHAFIQFLIQIVGSLQFLLIVNSDVPSMSENKRSKNIFSASYQQCARLKRLEKNVVAAKLSLHKESCG